MLNKLDPRVDADGDGRWETSSVNQEILTNSTLAKLTVETRPSRKRLSGKDYSLLASLPTKPAVAEVFHSTNSDVKDPTNAAHVPPSVLAETLGQPTILHGDKSSDHYHRHGSISHQEKHIWAVPLLYDFTIPSMILLFPSLYDTKNGSSGVMDGWKGCWWAPKLFLCNVYIVRWWWLYGLIQFT